MLGGNDFHSEPPSRRHVSEPSLTEMVRRARDARLGPTHTPHFTTNLPAERHAVHGRWFTGVALLVLGILIGAVLTALVGQLSARSDSATTPPTTIGQYATAVPTDTPFPTLTPTTTPMATDTPAGALTPADTEIVAVVRDYIDNDSIYTGAYDLTNAAVLQTQEQGQGTFTACVAYDYASITPGDTSYGDDMRLFTLDNINGAWTVTQMGESGSCTLN